MTRHVTRITLDKDVPYFSTCAIDDRKLKQACETNRVLLDADERVAAFVEVGAIPYRERYQERW